MRRTWMVLIAGVVPLALLYMVANEFISKITTTYEGYPEWFVGLFGWGMAGSLVVLALALLNLKRHPEDEGHLPEEHAPEL